MAKREVVVTVKLDKNISEVHKHMVEKILNCDHYFQPLPKSNDGDGIFGGKCCEYHNDRTFCNHCGLILING